MPEQDSQSPKRSVFISYSRKDLEFLRRLNESLDSSAIEAWVDWEGNHFIELEFILSWRNEHGSGIATDRTHPEHCLDALCPAGCAIEQAF